jgi:hypothetical protein
MQQAINNGHYQSRVPNTHELRNEVAEELILI